MNWGNAPAWMALVLSGGALWVSIKARGDGKRSADAAATSASASVRSAVAAEGALALQQQETAERRAVEAEAARPRPSLVVRHFEKQLYHLINEGRASAEGVRFVGELPASVMDAPVEVKLGPGGVHPFFVAPDFDSPSIAVLKVSWDGLDEPVSLRVPPAR
ncbi:hypothetical protein ABZ890_45640 [Streptomyces sp. NPDC046984]|uniref:hypothetical protein n=1 Tax=Streptomyces sp. NPDC046984 TaxID=3155138 RepID=UPI0033D9C77E